MEIQTIENITRGEIDIAISTAKKYPRSISKFRQDAMTMATADPEVAASCFYKLPRGGKSIEGPSVRLAEIVANAWGNLRFGARIIAEDDKFITAQGVAHDLERNVSTTVEVRRRITDKHGNRFNDDMIVVTCNAASSIALRNAIFKTVPFTYAKSVLEQAKKTAIGDAKSMKERRQGMVDSFAKMGVSLEQVLALVEKNSLEDVGLSEIETMIGVFTAIKDGDTTIDEQFQEVKKDAVKQEVAAEPAAQAQPDAKAAPVQPAPAASKQSPLQEFNTLHAKVKKELGKEIAFQVMEEHGQQHVFPSKIPEDKLLEMIEAYKAKLNTQPEAVAA